MCADDALGFAAMVFAANIIEWHRLGNVGGVLFLLFEQLETFLFEIGSKADELFGKLGAFLQAFRTKSFIVL